MTTSAASSNASVVCRLEWRPSRVLVSALAVLGLLSAVAVLASEMPRPLAWALALLAPVQGLLLARREARRPPCGVVVSSTGVRIDGEAVDQPRLHWRGPLAVLRWRDAGGRTRRLLWWPDTLDARARRELRLAMPAPARAAERPAVAP